MAYELPPLPYDADALEPHISERTVMLHYSKHHQGYADKLNDMIEGTSLEDEDIESIVRAAIEKQDQNLFNNAAQVWNHNRFWKSMSATPSSPSDELAAAISDAFEGMPEFNEAFKEAATGEFGSGWAWLVVGPDGLEVMSTTDADLPMAYDKTAIICCDVWEHAYYLDYQNERGKFVDAFLDSLINWEFASRLFGAADSGASAPREDNAA